MPLFIETAESVATAIVTVQRALENEVIEAGNYEGFIAYLEAKKIELGVTAEQINGANDVLDDELQYAIEELYMEEGDELHKMAEELLAEHEKEETPSMVLATWTGLSATEKAEMAALAVEWLGQ